MERAPPIGGVGLSGGGMIADPICDHALLISSQGAGARCMGCAGAPPAPQRLPGHIQRRCDGCEGKPSSEHTVHDLAQDGRLHASVRRR